MALLIEKHDRYVAEYGAFAREPKRRRIAPGDLPDESTDVEPAHGLAPTRSPSRSPLSLLALRGLPVPRNLVDDGVP
jgi:hypothetical protein